MCSLHSYSVKVPNEKERLGIVSSLSFTYIIVEPIQISVPACLHNVHSNYVHRHYLCPIHLS